jgi:AAA15 family ATPase/GTPase
MDFENLGGYSIFDLNLVNILLGKNGCGKSTALKAIDIALKAHPDIGLSKYITPERGGALKYQPQIETNISNDPNWLDHVSRKNQFTQFKEASVFQFRKLEMLALRELEKNVDGVRLDLNITFDTTIGLINSGN